jgi:hypothetical protein
MIDRVDGELVFHCDECQEFFESNEGEFSVAWGNAKRDGWTVRKIGNDWHHTCQECGRG